MPGTFLRSSGRALHESRDRVDREVPQSTLRTVFGEVLRARGVELRDEDLEGAWAPVYDPEREQSAPRVLLAGDAVGIDPWLGEGISSAIGTGIVAGHFASAALETGAFGFEEYRSRIVTSTVGEALRANREMASRFYGDTRRPHGYGDSWQREAVA